MRGCTDPNFTDPDFTGPDWDMDFAIAAVRRDGPGAAPPPPEWAVLCLHTRRGLEVAQHLARFDHRSHAEAFLADLLACSAPAPAGAGIVVDSSSP
jgi:hypothetical protein